MGALAYLQQKPNARHASNKNSVEILNKWLKAECGSSQESIETWDATDARGIHNHLRFFSTDLTICSQERLVRGLENRETLVYSASLEKGKNSYCGKDRNSHWDPSLLSLISPTEQKPKASKGTITNTITLRTYTKTNYS